MGFVKTPDEMKAIAYAQSKSLFYSENFYVLAESDRDYLNSIVPDPLRVTEAYFMVTATKTQTYACGDCAGLVVYVPCEHKGNVGLYMLSIFYTPEAAIQWGRDLVGEPKKMAQIGFHRFGGQRRAYCDRYNTRIIAMEGMVEEEVGPSRNEGLVWTVRSQLGNDWHSIEGGKAQLLQCTILGDCREEYVGTGTLDLVSTDHDPMGDLPVHGVIKAGGRESTFREVKREIVDEIDGDYYVPFFYGQHLDDWSKLTPAAKLLDW